MHEEHTRHIAEGFVRTLATALRTLRLYPPSSPIPQQSASLAAEALSLALSDVEAVTIRPERDGLICLGIPTSAPGAKDVSELLVAHGIAEVSFARGTTADHLAIFASLLQLAGMGMIFVMAMGQTMSPRLARYYRQGDHQGFLRLLSGVTAVSALLGIVPC